MTGWVFCPPDLPNLISPNPKSPNSTLLNPILSNPKSPNPQKVHSMDKCSCFLGTLKTVEKCVQMTYGTGISCFKCYWSEL